MTTIKDVAKKANVSISTVSRAFSGSITVKEKTKQKILLAAEELHYAPNNIGKYLKMGQTSTIGVLIPDIRNPIFPVIVRGIEDMARRLKYNIFLCNTDEDEVIQEQYVGMMRSMRAAGLIIATGQKHLNQADLLLHDKMPVVSIIRKIEGIDSILVDNAGGILKALNYLLDSGKKRIAICKGPDQIQPYRERFDAYKKRMEALGLYDSELVIDVNPFNVGFKEIDLDGKDIVYDQLKQFFQKPIRVDAILAANDIIAMKCLTILSELGKRVPQDIVVIGFDNVDICTMTVPPLSTVAQPLYDLGKYAVKRLVEKINNPLQDAPIERRFETTLILRKTT